jgi:hypothetical protein
LGARPKTGVMRRASARLALAGSLAVFVSGAAAQSVPPAVGGDLLRSCNALIDYAVKGGEITADATSCAAYLKGLRDGVEAPAPSRTVTDRAFCAPTAALDEMARVVVKHLQDRPEGTRASSEALAALGRAYPCSTKK